MRTTDYLLRDLLKEVSRSFYLTLRILPRAVRSQMGLAYLLARATDTIADTEIISVDQRLATLHALRGRILGATTELVSFRTGESQQPSERILLERINDVLQLLDACEAADRERIQNVLATIISGQELDLMRFGAANIKNISALKTASDLDDYTYRVAGCVGEFWTRMCLAHVVPELKEKALIENGIRFGKGLQLVNVLRDLPRDLRNGRCYLPEDELAQGGLAPKDLLDRANEKRLRPVYDQWIGTAQDHLSAGWGYTNTIPQNQLRLRLACAWPILIGRKTLDALSTQRILEPAAQIKISRSEVRRVIARSVVLYPFRGAWQAQFGR